MLETISLENATAEQLAAALKAKTSQKENDRKAYKELVVETIPGLIEKATDISKELQNFKKFVYTQLRDIMNTKHDLYAVKDEQQSHTFSDDNGNGIIIGYYVNDDWDDTVNSGIAKINDYIKALAAKEQDKDVIAIVNRLLKRDRKGNLKGSRVLELMSLAEEIESEVFRDGVNIIKNAYRPVRSKFFIKAYRTKEDGAKDYIPLSITTADFPKDFDFSFMLPTKLR